jgi:hypothetical protein
MKRSLGLVILVTTVAFLAAPAHADAPSNDNFSSPIMLSVRGESYVFTKDATVESGEPTSCGEGFWYGKTAWYSFTVPVDTPVAVSLGGSDFDTAVSVFTGASLSQLTRVGCSIFASQHQQAVSLLAAAGTTYYVQVGGMFGASGWADLNLGFGAGAALDLPLGYFSAGAASYLRDVAADVGAGSVVGLWSAIQAGYTGASGSFYTTGGLGDLRLLFDTNSGISYEAYVCVLWIDCVNPKGTIP